MLMLYSHIAFHSNEVFNCDKGNYRWTKSALDRRYIINVIFFFKLKKKITNMFLFSIFLSLFLDIILAQCKNKGDRF